VVLAIVLALCAAVLLALGFVIQQHAASAAPPDERLSFRILLDLVRRPMWLAGIAAMVGGQVLAGVALDLGSLPLVEPLLAANLLFALPMAATWTRQRLDLREWVGAIILMAGLAGFIVAAGPSRATGVDVSALHWGIAGAAIAGVVALLITLGKRTDLAEDATLIAAGAGILFGFQDALTQQVLHNFGHGIGQVFLGWEPYTLVAVAIIGITLAQSAFEAAPLAASLPAITIAEPITGIALGVGLFGEGIRLSPLPLAFELVGLALMVAGVFLVARSPIVTGEARRLAREHGEQEPEHSKLAA
jgi:drug/metabolite transporter (DMT)-like permease